MHKVLVVAYYFPPMGLSGVQRTLKFVKYLKKYNWEPTVLSTGNVAYFAHDNSLQEELENTGIRVIRVGGTEPNSVLSYFGTINPPNEIIRKTFNRISQVFYIPDNKVSWAKNAYKKCSELLASEHFDCVFISGPPFSQFDIFIELKKTYNIPIVLDYRDLWVDNQFSFYLTPLHKSVHRKKEYRALKSADKIIVTNRRIKEKIIKDYKFLTFDDVYIIPHGYDPEDFSLVKRIEKPNDKMYLTYSGLFYEYITPKYFLQAFKALLIEYPSVAENIRLLFIGFLRKENEKLVKKLKLEPYVSELGYLNHLETIQKLLMSDVLWMMVGRGKSAETISSGKLFEYFGARKPIIACLPNGALQLMAKEYKASFIPEPNNVNQIKNTILDVYKLFNQGKLPLPDEEFIQGLNRDYLTELLAKQLNTVLKV